ncbi:MAG: hypothetical protein IPJ08_00760 [Burkholderiales bacterium]|nr:hypothetical protein [Burkholderiales bacterium]MBP6677127.1 hypothetical protein [Vitreoscilla sp.]
MKNALSALLPLMLLCAGSVLLMALAAWTADSAAAAQRASPGSAAVTVASLTSGAAADATRRARPSGHGGSQQASK